MKPLIKWAGGKSRMLDTLEPYVPDFELYVEPFCGGAALALRLLEKYPNAVGVLNDDNERLMNLYRVLRDEPDFLKSAAAELERTYMNLAPELRAEMYYTLRDAFNSRASDKSNDAAIFLFLNKTCFNGLYRENKHGAFNVPHGAPDRVTVCDNANADEITSVLRRCRLECGDYSDLREYAAEGSFWYLDPPYKPTGKEKKFSGYSGGFGDSEQERLKGFCDFLDSRGAKFLLSNSGLPDYFGKLYEGYKIEEVTAPRSISRNGSGRRPVTELLIRNY